MKEHKVKFVIKNSISKKEIEIDDFTEASKILNKKKKLNPRSKWYMYCKVI
jgi:hypothetical protein